MHFADKTWRPPYEAYSVIIQATTGCTYRQCSFCNLYHGQPFRLAPLTEFEADLAEIRYYQPNARRIFLTGANPFAMHYDQLAYRARLIREYLPKMQTIAMFASIRDIKSKTIAQLQKLRALGINGLTIGTESGDEETLLLANKGYTAADIGCECQKLDAAGIEYYLVYMTGLAGHGGGYGNALHSAELFSQLNPYFISVSSLTLFPHTPLYTLAKQGLFIPAGEKERLYELQTFIQNLNIRTHLLADTRSNYHPFTAYLPKEREKALSELQYIIDHTDESIMQNYRASLKSL